MSRRALQPGRTNSVNGQTRAVVLYGEMRIGDEFYEERAKRAHAQAMLDLGVTGAKKDRLRRLLLGSRQFTREELNVFEATLPGSGLAVQTFRRGGSA